MSYKEYFGGVGPKGEKIVWGEEHSSGKEFVEVRTKDGELIAREDFDIGMSRIGLIEALARLVHSTREELAKPSEAPDEINDAVRYMTEAPDYRYEVPIKPGEVVNLSPAGVKYDDGKTRLDLLPTNALWEVASVFTKGAKKYGDRNWEKGIDYSRLFAAAMRHLFKWWGGDMYDDELETHHVANAVACLLMILSIDARGVYPSDWDDRPRDEHGLFSQMLRGVDDAQDKSVSDEASA